MAAGIGITNKCDPSVQEPVRTLELWVEFFSDPSQWWDNRSDEKELLQMNPRPPDFTHRTRNEALWIQNHSNPPWVYAKLSAMDRFQGQLQSDSSTPTASGRIARTEQLWQEFFSDPSQWWDNRFTKGSPRYPDFKHKSTLEGLWVNSWWNPPWVKTKITSFCLGGSRLRVPDSFCNEAKVRKLCQEGQLKEALLILKQVVQQTSGPPMGVYFSLLKECARRKALAEGKQVHTLMVQSGCDSDIFLANNLLDMYRKCGSVLDAQRVFTSMPERNLFSWTAVISAYADSGQYEEAINLFHQMQDTGIAPDKVAFVVVLRACAKIAALEQGKHLHSLILERGFIKDAVVQNTLLDMYAKCGCLEDARKVFNSMNERTVVTWNAMIAGYAQHGLGKEAVAMYEQMKQEGVQPGKVTFLVVLKAISNIGALKTGQQLHCLILERGLESDKIVQSTLIDMYAKCRCLEIARELFNRMNERDLVSWNVMIAGYEHDGRGKDALALYEQMKQEHIQPDIVTFILVLKACARIRNLQQGKQIHLEITRRGFELDAAIGNTLVDMYAKCGCLEEACEYFNNMSDRDVVSWNVMIAGYLHCGCGKEALALYEQMKLDHMQPDVTTIVLVLKACARIASLEQGKQLHSEIRNRGFESDLTVQITLIDMYAKIGCLEDACKVFNNLNKQDVVSWTAMIGGYVQNGLAKEALTLYKQMKLEDVQPNKITMVVVLKACASIAALEPGKQLHSDIIKRGFESDIVVQGALIDMYAKCGSLEDARRLFNRSDRDLVLWNTMIAGYAHNGLGKEALALHEQMRQEGVEPNKVTYICVLSACSHSGLIVEGHRIFKFMCETQGIPPTREHYACMVNLLGRGGCLANAEDFVMKLPIEPDRVFWMSLLGAARSHGHVEIGRHAFDSIVKLEPDNAVPYSLLLDIYAAAGRMNEVEKITEE